MGNESINWDKLGFDYIKTDLRYLSHWRDGAWQKGTLTEDNVLHISEGSTALHYGQQCFEGLKAYKWPDGRVALFRPEMNARRFNQSAHRICMPEIPEDVFTSGIEQLVSLERDWIPTAPETSLYIRPAMIAVDPYLGVKPSEHYYFFVILSPVGAYYAAGFNPVNILVEDHYVRAVPGGTGEAKTGGNYASSLMAAQEAKKKGYDQVLWLDGRERRFIEEVGAMNMFFAYGNKIVTAGLNGSILSGVTRDSVLKLAPTLGYEVEERQIDVNELMADIRAGKVTEAFGSGTAAVITPVGKLCYKDECFQLTGGKVGEITQKLYDTLTGIQTGKLADQFGWVRFIN